MGTPTLNRIVLMLAFVTATRISESCAQTVYYPLAKGNVWDYGGAVRQWVLIADTVVPDGKTYGIHQDTWYHQSHVERQQGDTVYSDGRLIYDFTRSTGDTLWQEGGVTNLLHSKGDTVLFGRTLRWWNFWRVSQYGG